jgi:polyisoprenoid-binding protein YceI
VLSALALALAAIGAPIVPTTAGSALTAAAQPGGASTYASDPATSRLTYHIVHKLHEVDAESRSVEARALLAPDGELQVMARAPVASFKSGDGNRDEHMLETVEAGKHPYVTFKGVSRVAPPTAFPATLSVTLEGELDFHGVRQPERVPITIALADASHAHVTGSFEISLDSFRVQRPSLLFVKIYDGCKIGVDINMRRVSP